MGVCREKFGVLVRLYYAMFAETGPLPVPWEGSLSYVDFVPNCLDDGGLLRSAVFERFDVLVRRGNEWLRLNPQVGVQTCESVELKASMGEEISSEKVTFWEGKHSTLFVRALRLWIVTRPVGAAAQPDQVGYVNMVPSCSDVGGIFHWPEFESLGRTIDRLNVFLQQHPLQGRIITIETQEMKMSTWEGKVDPDKSHWWSSEQRREAFLYVIRIFYLHGPAAYELIGCADFIPNCIGRGASFFSPDQFEPFSEVMAKAGNFTRSQQSIRITNVQSINYKLSHRWTGNQLDTHRSFFTESGEYTTQYLRIVRVSYVRPFGPTLPEHVRYYHPIDLHYKTFYPVQLSSEALFRIPKFETMSQTIRRAAVWLRAADCTQNLVALETVPVRMWSGNQYGCAEQTLSWNRAEHGEYWILVVRVYLDGPYVEPPPELLLPLPPISTDTQCPCALL